MAGRAYELWPSDDASHSNPANPANSDARRPAGLLPHCCASPSGSAVASISEAIRRTTPWSAAGIAGSLSEDVPHGVECDRRWVGLVCGGVTGARRGECGTCNAPPQLTRCGKESDSSFSRVSAAAHARRTCVGLDVGAGGLLPLGVLPLGVLPLGTLPLGMLAGVRSATWIGPTCCARRAGSGSA